MAVRRSPKPLVGVRFSPPEPMVDSTGVRRRLINSGDRSDGLERLGSNPRSTTKIFIGDNMKVYQCEVCNHIHDEAVDGKLEDLPKYANCPDCGSDAREVYKEVEL